MNADPDTCGTCQAPLHKQNVWTSLTPSERATATANGYRRKAAHGICCRCYERESRSPEGRAARNEAARIRAERIEDLTFMAEHGESLIGAASRLGITRSALEHLLERSQRRDLLATLTANNPHDWNKLRTADGLPTTRTPQAIAKRNANRNEKRKADRRQKVAA